MNFSADRFNDHAYISFKSYRELMSIKVREILLVSSPYDAFIIEEDGSLASRIINEYRGLNLSMPPRVIRTSSARQALETIRSHPIDIVITMPHLDDMDAFTLGGQIKKISPDLPVILLAHSVKGVYPFPADKDCSGIDKVYIWSGNSDLLLALIKNVEDLWNVDRDTQSANVRVLIFIEDSPVYRSSCLPLLYKLIVRQTQNLMVDGINEEHRLLKMRARPKIMLAETHEEALDLYQRYQAYLLGIISDTRFPVAGKLDGGAGISFLNRVKKENPFIPLLMMSSDPGNRQEADNIPAVFLDKNAPDMSAELNHFFLRQLGFGDFVFRLPDGSEVSRATDLKSLEKEIARVPGESLWYHARNNHFSSWIMARSEISLASEFRQVDAAVFEDAAALRQYIISGIRRLRRSRQKGVVAMFDGDHYDPDIVDFVKIGQGSLGGKGRSLAFMSGILQQYGEIHEKYPDTNIKIPKTAVVSTEGFESFVQENRLDDLATGSATDAEINRRFLQSTLPDWLRKELESFLHFVSYPLSVRSSSLLEDAYFQPYAGLYATYMIPNNHPDVKTRLVQLMTAIKLVYASAFYEGPRQFSKTTTGQVQKEAMAVILQQLAGQTFGDFFYPTFSGVIQSHNYYPFPPMKPEEGICIVALGFGKTVVEGERALRFSPRHPQLLPQFSNVDDVLKNSQKSFYALRVKDYSQKLNFDESANLQKRIVSDAPEDFPLQYLSSTYVPAEHRLRDSGFNSGPHVITFAQILKYNSFPLAGLAADIMALGRKGMGCPVEIEFSVNIDPKSKNKNDFYFLQMRPMLADEAQREVEITQQEYEKAFCRSAQALGNGKRNDICDIVYIKPDTFEAAATRQMAEEISRINETMLTQQRPYVLVGPGRWGSTDSWLGVPVRWRNVCGAGVVVELRNRQLKAEPSQGSHFFQNITSQGIHYLTITEGGEDCFDWEWLTAMPAEAETDYVRQVRLGKPLLVKVDGRTSRGVILKESKGWDSRVE